ncbi:hypothetical protein B0H19DRAFT_1271003 [Mycena capillaripes]|nr:hypothetical protein B0H19DRAFT_1271003 [Mycena capillaripes]
MADSSSSATAPNAPNPQQELEALVSLVAALSQMSLAMAKHCLDVQTKLPAVYNAAVAAAVASGGGAITPAAPAWIRLVSRTPDELDAAHPPADGLNDLAYHVVTKGREPGLYTSVDQSDYQVLGVPSAKRLKVTGRGAALAYYRERYGAQQVAKWGHPNDPDTPASSVPVSAPS